MGEFLARLTLAVLIGGATSVALVPACPWTDEWSRALSHLSSALRALGYEGADAPGTICWIASAVSGLMVANVVALGLSALPSFSKKYLIPAAWLSTIWCPTVVTAWLLLPDRMSLVALVLLISGTIAASFLLCRPRRRALALGALVVWTVSAIAVSAQNWYRSPPALLLVAGAAVLGVAMISLLWSDLSGGNGS